MATDHAHGDDATQQSAPSRILPTGLPRRLRSGKLSGSETPPAPYDHTSVRGEQHVPSVWCSRPFRIIMVAVVALVIGASAAPAAVACAPPASSDADGALLLTPTGQVLPTGDATTLEAVPLSTALRASTTVSFRVLCGPDAGSNATVPVEPAGGGTGGDSASFPVNDTADVTGTAVVSASVGPAGHRSVVSASVQWQPPVVSCDPALPDLFAALKCSAAAKFLRWIWGLKSCLVGAGEFSSQSSTS